MVFIYLYNTFDKGLKLFIRHHLILDCKFVRDDNNLALCFICRFTMKLLVAVKERWDSHVNVIKKVVP